MIKKEVQKRVLQNGNPLALDKFEWDDKAKVFSSVEDNLVIDFNDISYSTVTCGDSSTVTCGDLSTVKCGYLSTVKCGYFSTVKCGDLSTVKCGPSSTVTCGPSSTVTCGDSSTVTCGYLSSITYYNYDFFDVIKIDKESVFKICPYKVNGHLKLINNKWYLNGDKSLGEHIMADNILSKVVSKKGNVYKVVNHGDTSESFLITNGIDWSHGKTIDEANESLKYKIGNIYKSDYKDMKLETEYTLEEAIKMYRVITGACEGGVRSFLNTITAKDRYTVKEIIELTKGQYGNESLKKFMEAKK